MKPTPPAADLAPLPPLPPLFGKPRELALAAAALLLATLIVFADVLFVGGDSILSAPQGDLVSTFVGWSEFLFGEMAKGHVPLWNPHLFSGAPCLGGFQEALLYPPMWLQLFLPLPQALNSGIALHVFLAGLFTYAWMARRGLHPAAALVAGLSFMFGGAYYMHITAGHLPNLRTMVWAPLIFLAIDDLTSTRSLRGAWLGAGAVAMQILAGHPQYTYLTALVAAPYALVALCRAPSQPRAALGLALMGVGGAALSAAQLFTGLQATGESVRAKLSLEMAHTFPFPPENLLTLVCPGFFGPFDDYWGRWYLWEDCIFLGVSAIALALFGAIAGEKSQRRFTLVAFFAVILLVSFGFYTPLYEVLYRWLPGIGSFRGISKIIFLAMLFASALAGIGMDRVLRAPRLSGRAPLAVAGLSLLALFAAIAIWFAKDLDHGPWAQLIAHIPWHDEAYAYGPVGRAPHGAEFLRRTAEQAASSLLWCGAAGLAAAALWFAAGRFNRKWGYGLAVLAAIELMCFAREHRPTFDLRTVAAEENSLRPMLESSRLPPDARVATGMPSFVLGAGGNEAWGNDPMVLRRYAEFMADGQGVTSEEMILHGYPFWVKPSPKLWGMVRLGVFVSPENGRFLAVKAPMLRRAQLIEDVKVLPNKQQLLATILDPTFDPQRTVLLEAPIAPMPTAPSDKSVPSGKITSLKDIDTDQIEIEADIARPCVLLISDNYSAGWIAEPRDSGSGQKYQLVPADYTLRGIPLPPGKHALIVRYAPSGFVWGRWVSCLALLAYAAAGWWLWKPLKKQEVDAKEKRPGKKKAQTRTAR